MEQTIDYREVGLIVGLEVHQQLLTDYKMFCRCPAGRYTKTHDGEVLRHMRPTLSELGEYDGTALMEFKTKKNIIYLLHKSNVCTYEMDDTPPFLMNPNALDVAIEQCLMLGCDIVDEVHVARKQYLDGSIPTGFQRTAIVGVGGKLPFLDRHLTITQVSVEEDSCREVSDQGHLIVWRTDRLGMPLIETVTGPDLRTPEEVVEAILLIGRVCRSTGHVRVGMGASRQDVNVSVRGGRRVEIKGVPQAWWAKQLVHGEAVRQVNLLQLRDQLRRRGFKRPEDIRVTHQDITTRVADSAFEIFRREHFEQLIAQENRRQGFELGKGPFCVRGVRLAGLAGTLNWPGQPNHTFAHELSGRVRVIAGLDWEPVLVHGEAWPEYTNADRELAEIRSALGCDAQDGLAVVWGPQEDTVTAAEEIRLRYIDALEGVPNETRQPFVDGHTCFERILPGPDRMYPDTDSPPIRIVRERVGRLRASLPPPPWERAARYGKAGVPEETICYLIRRGGARRVDLVIKASGADVRDACFFFGQRLKGLRRSGVPVDRITDAQWCAFFEIVKQRPVLFEAWQRIVTHMASAADTDTSLSSLIKALGFNDPALEWQDDVAQVATMRPDWDNGDPAKRLRYLMGRVMPKLRGRIAAREVARSLRTQLMSNANRADKRTEWHHHDRN
ncbi:MAG: Glu-tRNA(Gln) amidotransferase subunit GatE [Myxococcota bacterium]|nr:Glu-tRNA(Gln) amidotransferase subunit GatE [Myxococcota bacterium]